MSTKLTAASLKRLVALSIKAKDEETAKAEICKKLVKEGIDGMEGEDLDTLLDMLESFVEEEPAEEDDEEADVEEAAEEEEEEEEVPAPKKKAIAAPAKPVAKATPAKPTKKAPPVEEEEEDDEEEEEVPAPKKKTAAVVAKPVAKAAPAKPVMKAAAKATVAPTKAVKLNPQKNEADRAHFDVLKTIFPEKSYLYAWIASNGVTVKYKGKNSNRSVTSLENVTLHEDGTITCNAYLQTFGKKKDSLDEAGIEYAICWSGVPFMKNVPLDEAIEVLTQFLEEIEGSVGKLDKKLGENRVKMEESLKKGSEKASAKPSKKPVAKVEEDEDDEPTPAPKKKVVAAPAKPVAKVVAKPVAKPVMKVVLKKK